VNPSSPEASQGGHVEVIVASDVDDEVHIHGYDIMLDVSLQEPAKVRFTADIPGIFEVELEQSTTFLFDLTARQPRVHRLQHMGCEDLIVPKVPTSAPVLAESVECIPRVDAESGEQLCCGVGLFAGE
jgi:hypothetical protein